MKLFFNLILIFQIIQTHELSAQAIIMSGKYSLLEKQTAQQITKELIGENELVRWEQNNPDCKKRIGHLLQLCWRGTRFFVVYQKRNILKKSIGRLIDIQKQEKAFKSKASI